MDFFCTFHDSMCCQGCIAEEHRSCEKVHPLRDAAKNVKQSALFSTMSDDLKQMVFFSDSIIGNREENIQKLKMERDTISTAISSYKESIIATLNQTENQAKEKLSTVCDASVSTLKTEATKAEQIKSKVEMFCQQMEFLEKNGSNNQIFLFLQNIKSELIDEDQCLEHLQSTLQEVSLSYKETEVLVNEAELGLVKITQNKSFVPYKQGRQTTAQSSLNVFKTPKAFTLQNKITIGGNVQITGISLLSDNKLILANNNCNKLLIYKTDGTCSNQVELAKSSWDVVYNDKKGKVITTLDNGKIQIIENLEVTSTVTVPGEDSCGIEWVNDKLYVGGNKEIHILNSDMKFVKTIKLDRGYIYYIHYRNDEVYLSDCNDVYCIQEDGTQVFTFSSPDLEGPDGITSDGNGNIYVVGRWSNNIHRLSSDGTSSDIVMSSKDGIKDPIAICFSKDYRKLVVSNEGGETLWVFNCEY